MAWIWLSAWVRALTAEFFAVLSIRIISTVPSLAFGPGSLHLDEAGRMNGTTHWVILGGTGWRGWQAAARNQLDRDSR